MTYFNTTGQSGTALTKFKRAAANQDDKVLDVFKRLSKSKLTPEQVWLQAGVSDATPITSIRRSLTNLTKRGELVKTDTMKWGPYGRPCHTWTLKTA